MSNEIILILSLLFIYSSVIVFFKIFGKAGLYCFSAVATVTANIEVMILVKAFGIEQTLGNILFASTFLITDIISELYDKKSANRAVNIGIGVTVFYIILTNTWMLYTPSESDWVMPSIVNVFSNTPRIMLSGIIVYAICQRFDVWLYHKWWRYTGKKTGNTRALLWVRNNGSTLVSQLLNSVLFNFCAFYGMYEMPTLITIVVSTYLIYIATSLLDTPFIYLARKIADKHPELITENL